MVRELIKVMSSHWGSKAAMARALGIVPSAIGNWERAGNIPDAQKWRLFMMLPDELGALLVIHSRRDGNPIPSERSEISERAEA